MVSINHKGMRGVIGNIVGKNILLGELLKF